MTTYTGIFSLSQHYESLAAGLWWGVPDAPAEVTAAFVDAGTAVVSFAGAKSNSSIVEYTVTSFPGNIVVKKAKPPVTVPGLSPDTEYTFTVSATNEIGIGPTAQSDTIVPLSIALNAGLSGLAGKFFDGAWRNTIGTGNIGTLPLTSVNDSVAVNMTSGLPSAAHAHGVNVWPSIGYGQVGSNYGFIAIGYFKPPTTGTYTFYTYSDDYSGVWVGDAALPSSARTYLNATVNNGMDLGAGGQGPTKRSGSVSLTADTWYPVRIVHEDGGGGNNLTFSWNGPGIAETTDLLNHFKTPANAGVVTGDYL